MVAGAKLRRPEGVKAREAIALETIRLVLPNDKPSPAAGAFCLARREPLIYPSYSRQDYS